MSLLVNAEECPQTLPGVPIEDDRKDRDGPPHCATCDWKVRFLKRALERRQLLAVVVGVDNDFLDDLVEFGVAPSPLNTLRRIAAALGPASTRQIVARFRIQRPSRCKCVSAAKSGVEDAKTFRGGLRQGSC